MNMSRGSMLVWLTVIGFIFTLAPPSMPAIIPENNDQQVQVDGGNGNADGKQDGSKVDGDPQSTDPPEVTYQHTFEAARVSQVPSEPVEVDHQVPFLTIVGIVLLAIVVIVVALLIAMIMIIVAARRQGAYDCAACKQHHKGAPPSGHKADKKDEKKPTPKGTGKVHHNNTATTAKPSVAGESKKEDASKRPKSWPISDGQTGGGNDGGAQSDTTRSGNTCTELSATANHYTSPGTNTTSDGQKPKVNALVDHHNQQNK